MTIPTDEEIFNTIYNVKSPIILDDIAKGYSSKITGEGDNIKFLWCLCTSKDLPKKYRLSTVIISQSSAGKSNLVNNILAAFEDDVISYTDYTNAFLKRMDVNMNGKIFKLEQMEHKNEDKQVTLSAFKFLLSEGKIRMGLVERDGKGKLKQQVLEVNGIPAFVSTSTNFNIDQESQNRLFLQQVDETQEQTKNVVVHTLADFARLSINDTWEKDLTELKKLAAIYKALAHQVTDIIIPFSDKIIENIPTHNISIRRDLTKVLGLTCVVAFMHAAIRKRVVDKQGKDFVIDQFANTEKRYTYAILATPDDLKEALNIAGTTLKQTLNKVTQVSMDIYAKVKTKIYEKVQANEVKEAKDGKQTQIIITTGNANVIGVTVREMTEVLHLSENRTRELLKQLRNAGFLTREKDGKILNYFLSDKEFVNIDLEGFTFSDNDLQAWIEKELTNHNERFEVLDPNEPTL